MKKTKIAFAGGGTGGHIYPIIAVYEKLKTLDSSLEFIYFGSKSKPEEKISAENNIPFISLPSFGGMPRSFKAIWWFCKFIFISLIALQKLLKEKPNLVFGTGGYVAGPVFLAAYILRIPYVIHNLDAYLGLANAAFIKGSAALTLGLPLNQKFIYPNNGPVIITGNPLREAFFANEKPKNLNLDSKRKTLIVTGGSQGAQAINEIILKITPQLINENWQIIHQIGEGQFAKLKEYFPQSPYYKPFKYLNNLAQIYTTIDLAISRSGAMSVAELTAKKVPTIFIPLPTAAQNHQWHNAKQIEEIGACLLLEQKDLNEDKLLEYINLAFERRNIFKVNLSELSKSPNSAGRIAKIIFDCAK